MNFKKGDNILIVKGKDKGKKAKIERVYPAINKISITGLNTAKKHLKPSKKNPQGGIINKNMPINIANIKLVCGVCNKSSKIGYKLISDKKIRICKKCNQSIDK